jgi:hypothetical protein
LSDSDRTRPSSQHRLRETREKATVDDGRPSMRSAQFRDLIAILVPFSS